MTTDDPSGYLPPHELRGLIASLIDRGSPGPSAAIGGSPGLATAAIVPPPTAPTIAIDDPTAMALVIAQLAGELFGGASVAQTPMQPASLATAAGLSSPGSPGISPHLVPAQPEPSPQRMPVDVGVPPIAGVPAVPESSVVLPLGSSAWGVPSELGSRGAITAPSNGLSSAWATPPDERSPDERSPDLGSLGSFGAAPALPFAPSGDFAGIPAMDRIDGAAPPVGGAGAALSPPGIAPPSAAPIPHGAVIPTSDYGWPSSVVGEPNPHDAPTVIPPDGAPALDIAVPSDAGSFELVPLLGDARPSSAIAMPEAFRVPIVDGYRSDAHNRSATVPRSNVAEPAPAPRSDVPTITSNQPGAFDPYAVRRDFPILEERVHGKQLVWLDNAATTQKPRAVIDRLSYFYEHENSNVHRAAHALAARATDAFESARETTRKFLNAGSASEIVFVRGATEGINLIAKAWGRRNVERGDEIVVTHLEHHANIVPWQQLCAETGARLRVAPVDDRGDVILEQYEKLFCSRTKLVSFTQVSNALGTITPARAMIEIAHRYGATVVLDGAQAVSHMPVDVQQLDCDFYVFSGHKVFAPTGIGAVFGKRAILDDMPPWQGGGNMIQDVTFERTTYQPPPGRFEAGTGNIADAAGMGAALDYIMRIGLATIDRYEHDLLVYATERLVRVPGLRMIGTSASKAGVLSFVLEGQRTEDVGAALDKDGIAVRSGHHCAQPILRRFGLESSVRASLAFYNIREDIDTLIDALNKLQSSRRGV